MGPDGLLVGGLGAARIGDLAAAHQVELHELSPRRPSLEQAFMDLTSDAGQFQAGRARPATDLEAVR